MSVSTVDNILKPSTTQSSCDGPIQAFTVWMGRSHAAAGAEGMYQEIHHQN